MADRDDELLELPQLAERAPDEISQTDRIIGLIRDLDRSDRDTTQFRKPFRVLSIDGGGIRGVIPARVLQHLESELDRPVHRMFDLIVGTSTGGIIALALTVPGQNGEPRNTAASLRQLYEAEGRYIFGRGFPRRLAGPWIAAKYSSNALREQLAQKLGSAHLSDALAHVLVTSWDTGTAALRLYDSEAVRGGADDPLMVHAALATAAAPTYFPACDTLVDGGVVANNPILLAYVVAREVYEQRPMLLLSLGTGRARSPARPMWAQGLLPWAKKAPRLLLDAPNEQAIHVMRLIQRLECARRPTINAGAPPALEVIRLQPDIGGCDDALDAADPQNVKSLLRAGEALLESRARELAYLLATL